MNRNKKIIYIMVVLLAVIAGWLYFENSSGKEVRAMGFPSIRAVPDGFNYAEAKSIDTGDWCEVTYENGRGGFVSLDCYVPGSFDTAFLENYAGSKDKTTVGNKEAVLYRNLAENDSRLTILTWNDMAQNAQCVLGGNVSLDALVRAAESIRYDKRKTVAEAENSEITCFPQQDGTVDETYLNEYADVLKYATKLNLEDCKKSDPAIKEFALDSFYKCSAYEIADDVLVEIFDFEYVMKADRDAVLSGGMYWDEDGNVRYFFGAFGQIVVLSRDGKFLKACPVTRQDIKIELDGRDEEGITWAKARLDNNIKSPAYLKRNIALG